MARQNFGGVEDTTVEARIVGSRASGFAGSDAKRFAGSDAERLAGSDAERFADSYAERCAGSDVECFAGTADGAHSAASGVAPTVTRQTGLSASAAFSRAERSYCEMLEGGGILVDDRWFARDSSPVDRARYHVSFLKRQKRNQRRREVRKAATAGHRERPSRQILSLSPEAREANRVPFERRKCQRRSTLAACPTASEIRTAWRFRNDSPANRVRLGALLMDLECYVDNALIWNRIDGRLLIVGRKGGLRAWIREKCPELEAHYKTLQRIKGIAKRLRQELDMLDPMPLSALMDIRFDSKDLASAEVHVQPRGGDAEPVKTRYPWERSGIHIDANGRPYLEDENYHLARYAVSRENVENIPLYRSLFRSSIILNGTEKCTNENYVYGGDEWEHGGMGQGGTADGKNGIVGEFGEMVGYVRRHPEFLTEVGKDVVTGIARAFAEVLLPERTQRRMADGERVGVGKIALDIAEAYMRFYDACLVCHWGRLSCSENAQLPPRV